MLGLPLGPFAAVAIDSVAYAARGIVFFVPAGVVLQEAGLVGAGLVFGLAPAQALALGLVLRLRDVVLGASLLAWPVLEWRRHAPKGPRSPVLTARGSSPVGAGKMPPAAKGHCPWIPVFRVWRDIDVVVRNRV